MSTKGSDMKIKREEVKTVLVSVFSIAWAIFFPGMAEHYFNVREPGDLGPMPYTMFLPLVYILSAFPFLMGCYFLYDLIKSRRSKK